MVVNTDFTLFPKSNGTMTIDYGVRTPTPGPCAYTSLTLEGYNEDGRYHYDPSKVGEEQPSGDKRVHRNTLILIMKLMILILKI